MRRRFFCLLTTSLLILAPVRADAPEAQPNLLFILADDLGWMDTSIYGSRFLQTPHIDQLARQGRIFTRAYAANPLCSPTRASILTGLDPARIGITTPACHLPREVLESTLVNRGQPHQKALQARSATRLKTDYVTLAETMKEAGYATGHFGKWHLGPDPFSARDQGFDVDVPHYPGPGPAGSFVAPWKFPPKLGFQGEPGEHLEERMCSEAIAWMRKNQDRPFFLNYWCFSVHAPFDARADYIESARPQVNPGQPQRSPTYHAMVRSLDDAVGRLLHELDELQLADRTLVVFFSDNGGNMYDRIDGGIPPTSNAPLRGGKANIYEGGVRVPLMVRWPGRIPAHSRTDALFCSTDFYPTLLDLFGLPKPAGQPLDGLSQARTWLKGEPTRQEMFSHFPHYTPATGHRPATAMWEGPWKLIRWYCDDEDQSDRLELFDLKTDIGETHNLATSHPEVVARMNRAIDHYLERTQAVRPRLNPAYQQPQAIAPSSDEDLTEVGLIYKRVDGRDLEVVAVRPANWKPTDTRAAMIFFHGGAWVSGSPQQFLPFARHLAQRGMVTFSAQYRLLDPQTQTPPLVCIEDAKSVVRWIRSLSIELGVDPGRIGVGGGSAGGHLAACTGLIDGLDAAGEDRRVSSRADALVLFNPVFDNGPDGWGHARVGARYPRLSPFHNVSADDPPTLVMSGSEDKLIPVSTIRAFQEALQAEDVRCDVQIYEGAGHGFFNAGRHGDRYYALTRDAMDAFLVSLGWLKASPE